MRTKFQLLVVSAMIVGASACIAAEPTPGAVRGVPEASAPDNALERVKMIRTSAEMTSVDSLKQAYLACDKKSREAVLDFDDAMFCTIFADELKARAFSGDFHQMIAWWQSNKLPD